MNGKFQSISTYHLEDVGKTYDTVRTLVSSHQQVKQILKSQLGRDSSMKIQQLFDHATDYFHDRLTKHGGTFIEGWGSCTNPAERCVIGSLVTGVCKSEKEISRSAQYKIFEDLDSEPDTRELMQDIMAFNDVLARRSQLKEVENPRYEINEFLKEMAKKYKLNYLAQEAA